MSEQSWCIIQHIVQAVWFCYYMLLFKDEDFCGLGSKQGFLVSTGFSRWSSSDMDSLIIHRSPLILVLFLPSCLITLIIFSAVLPWDSPTLWMLIFHGEYLIVMRLYWVSHLCDRMWIERKSQSTEGLRYSDISHLNRHLKPNWSYQTSLMEDLQALNVDYNELIND